MIRRAGWLAIAACCLARLSAAQSAEHAAHATDQHRLSWGGEISAVISPSDEAAYFNYTDYDRNILRIARIRLNGEWRIHPTLAVLADVRADGLHEFGASSAYVRWQPSSSLPLSVQAGRIPPVIGAFPRRAYGRDNVVIGQPLAYQYLTSLRPDAIPATPEDLVRMRGRGWQPSFPIGSSTTASGVPLVSASRWDTGVEVSWQPGLLEAAAAVTRGAPATPVIRDSSEGVTWSGRTAVRLGSIVAGVSAARGRWLKDSVLDLTPEGRAAPGWQHVVGVDAEWGYGRWLIRGEWLRASFDVPVVANGGSSKLRAWSGFGEARWRVHPRWQVGTRIERLTFSRIATRTGDLIEWDAPVDRIETAVGYRATRQLDVRAGWQHNWRDGGRVTTRGYPVLSALWWF
jgi:hypothetical protein